MRNCPKCGAVMETGWAYRGGNGKAERYDKCPRCRYSDWDGLKPGLACLLERGAERIIQVEDMYTRKGARLIWPEEEQA